MLKIRELNIWQTIEWRKSKTIEVKKFQGKITGEVRARVRGGRVNHHSISGGSYVAAC